MIISPSLLACDFLNIEAELKAFEGFENTWFHLDIMDSHFVPNLTFGHPIVSQISKKTDIPLDAHFMVTDPEFYIDTFKNYKIYNFTFHIEAADNALDLVLKAKKLYPSVGISIKPKTPLESINDELLKEIDLILIMSVEPGFGGQSFIEESFSRVEYFNKLKTKYPQLTIQVDGGVSNKNAQALKESGADNLVAGSYIFKEGPSTYKEKLESLRR